MSRGADTKANTLWGGGAPERGHSTPLERLAQLGDALRGVGAAAILADAAEPVLIQPAKGRSVKGPADANANSFPPFPCIPPPPVVSEGEHVPFPEHIPCLTFPHSQTHTHAPLPISTPTRCRPPLCAAWTAATSSCRTAGSRVLPRPSQPPCDPPRHSLRHNGLNENAMQAVRDAAGSGVSITFDSF